MKARVKFRKYGALRFIGHLDVMRYFQKALRRAEIPVAFTSGYSPHMIMSFASPLGVGLTSDGEYFDLELQRPVSSGEAVRRLNDAGVEGIEVLRFLEIPEGKKSGGMSIVSAADYLVTPKQSAFLGIFRETRDAFFSQPSISVQKKTKRSEKEADIRPMIRRLEVRDGGIFMRVAAGSRQNLKPSSVMEAFCRYAKIPYKESDYHFHRMELYAFQEVGSAEERKLVSLEALGSEMKD